MDEMMIEFGLPKMKIVSTAENKKNRKMVIDEWQLGPEKTSVEPSANKQFWVNISKAWLMSEKEARRRLCANCEYFKNKPMMQAMMESIPLDKFDMDGGGRGYCEKFDFICHNLRVCQAWEEDD
jgi:hypothetical protein